MSGGLKSAARAGEGAVAAHDSAVGDAAAPGSCRNCGTALAGDYCFSCGQNSHLHRTLGGFGHDLLHGAIHFDGKFWRTLPLLA